MSKVAVIGAGYVGLTTAACLADLGNDVMVVDVNKEKIAQLKSHRVPFFEPGLSELVERNITAGRLKFTTEYEDAVPGAEYAIIAVSTPEGEGGEADLSYVEAAANSIADSMDGPLVVVNKSTVPPLTGDMVASVLKKRNGKHAAHVVSNPEFLREGSAIQDFMHPDRVVVGSHDRKAAEMVAKLYEPLEAPILVTPNIYTAEMIKYASNSFLAARISFINEIARISERVGADAKLVAEGMGLDKRIGPAYLDAGIGYGGSCLVGDETVLIRRAGGVHLSSLGDAYAGFYESKSMDVLAWRPDTGSVEFMPVSAATLRPHDGEILEVRTKMGRRVRCTPDHPFVTRDGVKLAHQLTTDDWLPLALQQPQITPAIPKFRVLHGVEHAEPARFGEARRDAIDPLPFRAVELQPATHLVFELPSFETARIDVAAQLNAEARVGFWRAAGQRIHADHQARLPDRIWDEPVEHKRALLEGYWSDDGTWSHHVRRGSTLVLECATTSRDMADGLLRLLGDLGVVASMQVGRAVTSTRRIHRIRCSGADQLAKLVDLVPESDRKLVLRLIKLQPPRIARPGYRLDGRGTAWVRVMDIKRRPFAGPVYSLEVPGAHTFVTTGGLVTHNCFPKDVAALAALAERFDYHPELLHAVMDINRDQRMLAIDKLRDCLDSLNGRVIGLLGLAFKPNTDDLREAPSIDIAKVLLAAGAQVRAFDPAAMERAQALVPDVQYVKDAYEVASGADALVLVTEWNEFRHLDFARLKQVMRRPVMIDGRNIYDPEVMRGLGFTYRGIGRE
ncbi:MAG: nucleotide sugar dehydrogenase [Chloroflexi bacterium]|nr:MAG: nucleotide sugar dehydrogenase [Chloroflexota bacterium]